ncbi:hypothetical protein VTK73DRAFT_814 [Phialemonium thermophilum]|uniref:NmrA-like domain-containing protein n=1 Tax=Phialemonium thermophilum TaxID=223376 RepID=A0ABR3XD71_9PEZI
MSLPVLTVCAALGRQGAGVVSAFTSEASPQYHVRALTSNPESAAARELASKPNVSVVKVDLHSLDSVVAAFEGSTLIFANTVFPPDVFVKDGAAKAEEAEASHGLNIARAAAKTSSLKHLIWSTLPDVLSETGGKLNIPHFQSKIPAERYILEHESGLANKTTFLRLGLYGSVIERPTYTPVKVDAANARLLILPIDPDAVFPFIGDETFNTGLLAKAIFSQPDKTTGTYVNGTIEAVTGRRWASNLEKAAKAHGKDVRIVFLQSTLSGFEQLWGATGTEIGIMFQFWNDYSEHSYDISTAGRVVLTPRDLGVADQLRGNEDAMVQFL